jgi:integrase
MKWFNTGFPGVRYRKHPTRKHGVRFDQYFSIRYQYNRKRIEEGCGWASKGWSAQKAALILAELKEAQKTGSGPTSLAEKRKARDQEAKTKAVSKMTVKSLFHKRYLPQALQDKTPATCAREKSLFNLWLDPVLAKLPLSEVAPIHLERVKKDMKKAHKSPRSIQYALALVRQIFNFAARHGIYTGTNPVHKVKGPKLDNKRVRFLTREEAQELLEKLQEKSPEVWALALLSLHCGLRAGEIYKLTWGAVDLEKGLLLVAGKGNKSRYAYMTEQVKDMLSDRSQTDPDGLVFPDRKGQLRSSTKGAPATFRRTVDELGLNDGFKDSRNRVVFHTLRHTYASWLVQQGEDLYVIRDRLGHSTLAMTERYSHLAPDSGKRTVEKIENFFKQPQEGVEDDKEEREGRSI